MNGDEIFFTRNGLGRAKPSPLNCFGTPKRMDGNNMYGLRTNEEFNHVIVQDGNQATIDGYVENLHAGTVKVGTGATINSITVDGALTTNSDLKVPTEKAIRTYISNLVIDPTPLDYVDLSSITRPIIDTLVIKPTEAGHYGEIEVEDQTGGNQFVLTLNPIDKKLDMIASGGGVHVTNDTQSASYLTGSLVLDGGFGVAKDMWINGAIKGVYATDATSHLDGAMLTAGGMGIAKKLFVGESVHASSLSALGTTAQLALKYDAGNTCNFTVGSTGKLTIDSSGNEVSVAATDVVKVLNTTVSTTKTQGCAIFSGGIGVADAINAKKIWTMGGTLGAIAIMDEAGNVGTYFASDNTTGIVTVSFDGGEFDFKAGTKLIVKDTTPSGSSTTGALQVVGGIGVQGQIRCDSAVYTGILQAYHASLPQLMLVGAPGVYTTIGCSAGGIMDLNGNSFPVTFNSGSVVKVLSDTNSTSTATGALQVTGGLGVAKSIYSGGHLVLTGGTTALPVKYADVSSSFVAGGATLGTFATRYKAWTFPTGADNNVHFMFSMPLDWKESTELIPQVTWSQSGTDTGSVRFNLYYVVSYAGSEFYEDTTMSKTIAAAPGAVTSTITTVFSALPMAGITNPVIFKGLLIRNGTGDTCTDSIYVHSFGFRYSVSKLGV